jgi:ribonucleoside-diphosphate reductase alpha chain
MLLTQKVAFNSPVWFNVGCDRLEPDAEGRTGTGTRPRAA